MLPFYVSVARIEGSRHGDLISVDCATCRHIALLAPAVSLKLGLSPAAQLLDRVTGRRR